MPVLPLLALAGAFLLPQDEPAKGTSETLRTFLRKAESSFYHPQDDGLEQLSFVVPLSQPKASMQGMFAMLGATMPADMPDEILLFTVSVAWTATTEPQIETTIADTFPTGLEMMRTGFEGAGTMLGQQSLSAALNGLIAFAPLLESYDGRFDGAEGDFLRVVFERKPDVPEQVASAEVVTWLFDEDGVPQGTNTTVKQQGPMGPIEVAVETKYVWRPVRTGDNRMILEKLLSSNSMGAMGSVEQTTEYQYGELDGAVVVTGYRETTKPTGMLAQMPSSARDVAFEDMKVNAGEG